MDSRFLPVLVVLVFLSGCTSQFAEHQNAGYEQTNPSLPGYQSENQNLNCKGNGTVALNTPMRLEDISLVIPMGAMVGDHVTPIDHMYFSPAVFDSPQDTYDVYADADGVIMGIGVEPENPNNKYPKIRLTIYHTCDFYSIYNLLTSLSPRILNITGTIKPGSYSNIPIAVKQGELLGKIGGQTLDYSVNYDKVLLKGFIVPEHYAGESWKLHTVDPFDYFAEPFRAELLAKDLRQVEPRGGKIDYDIDGRLAGNWFIEGSGGYPEMYVPELWRKHASFAYDHIDPGLVVVSLGNFNGSPMQFSVKGNAPDPKDISVPDGSVKYELVETAYELGNGELWDRFTYRNDIKAVGGNYVKGVVLVQLISDRKLKLEVFPGKTAGQVAGFTDKAQIYER